MTAWNSAATIREGIESLLKQSQSDFELVVVDDGSSDDTVPILRSIRDPRVRLIALGRNEGPAAASNIGFRACRGHYIARADSDDLHVRSRLERQERFLDGHPEIAAVSCYLRPFTEPGRSRLGLSDPVWTCFDKPEPLKAHLLFETSLPHPGLMLRRSSMGGLGEDPYDSRFRASIDYDLLTRMVTAGLQLAAVKAPLVHYRQHPASLGSRQRSLQVALANSLRLGWLHRLGLEPDPASIRLHNSLAMRQYEHSLAYLDATERWFSTLLAANQGTGTFSATALSMVLGEKWYDVCHSTARHGLRAYDRYIGSPLPFTRPLDRRVRLRIHDFVLSRTGRAH